MGYPLQYCFLPVVPDGVVVVVAFGVISAVVGEDAAAAVADEIVSGVVADDFALVGVIMPFAAAVVEIPRDCLAFSPQETPTRYHKQIAPRHRQ